MIKFSVGCGKRNWPDWYNVDGVNLPHIHSNDITLQNQLDNYIDLLYSSHLIAYFDRQAFAYLLYWWYAKIKPGGILRLATPDFNILSKMYQVGIEFDRLTGPLYGEMEMNGKKIYHKTCYDESSLTALLTAARFINIRRYDHTKTIEHPNTGNREDFFDDQSAAYIQGALISLNIEATKL